MPNQFYHGFPLRKRFDLPGRSRNQQVDPTETTWLAWKSTMNVVRAFLQLGGETRR
jgi:hypothetical protein